MRMEKPLELTVAHLIIIDESQPLVLTGNSRRVWFTKEGASRAHSVQGLISTNFKALFLLPPTSDETFPEVYK